MGIFTKTAEEMTAMQWQEVERRSLLMAKEGADMDYVQKQRREMWEALKAQLHHETYARYPQQPPSVMPSSPLLDAYEKAGEIEKQRQAAQQVAVKNARVKHMQSGAMLCSITDGVNLWVARWGDGWVEVAEVQRASAETDAFRWDTLCERFKRTNKLELDGEYVRIVT